MRRGECAWLRLRLYFAALFLLAGLALLARMAVSHLGNLTMRLICRIVAVLCAAWPFVLVWIMPTVSSVVWSPLAYGLFMFWSAVVVGAAVHVWHWGETWGDDV